MEPEEFSDVLDTVARRALIGKVIPVLGAGANLVERPPDAGWERGRYLPSGRELATELGRYIHFRSGDASDLARVSQYVSALEGEGSLYEELHAVFDADYPPTRLHRMLADVSARVRRETETRRCMVLMTTNYDDALERAFDAVAEPYDVLTYIAEGRDRGRFRHTAATGGSTVIEVPNEYGGLRLDERAVIIKIHGAVDRHQGDADSFVITEDDYIDYISRADVSSLFPALLARRLKESSILFLGYSLRDWNVRAMLYRLWEEQEGRKYAYWAVDAHPDPIDRSAWDKRGVKILPMRLEDFVDAIQQRIATGQQVTP